jgi:hypothetical protein
VGQDGWYYVTSEIPVDNHIADYQVEEQSPSSPLSHLIYKHRDTEERRHRENIYDQELSDIFQR